MVKEKNPTLEEAKAITSPGKTTKGTFSVKLGKEKFGLEEFCNYKSMLVLEILGDLSEKFDLSPIITAIMATQAGEDSRIAWAATAVRVLPQALKVAPREITRLAALSLIANKKVAELYDEPNGISDEIKRVGKLIDLEGKPGLPLTVIKEAMPYMGLDVLKNGLTGLFGAIGESLPAPEESPSTG